MVSRWLRLACTAAFLGVTSSACVAADAAPLPMPPPVVYVANFELDVANVTPESGPGQRIRRLLPDGPLRRNQDPQSHAHDVVELMAKSLTEDLKKAGIDARRVAPSEPLRATEWQVRGVFLSVDEGNRLRRAMVGVGAGQSQFQVAVSYDDLASPDMPPLYESVEQGKSKGMPSAVIKLNPYVIAAKVVLSDQDEKKAIKRTAQEIADLLAQRLQVSAK